MTWLFLLAAAAVFLWPKKPEKQGQPQFLSAADALEAVRIHLETHGKLSPAVTRSLNTLTLELSREAVK
jgi:hypothetical protein